MPDHVYAFPFLKVLPLDRCFVRIFTTEAHIDRMRTLLVDKYVGFPLDHLEFYRLDSVKSQRFLDHYNCQTVGISTSDIGVVPIGSPYLAGGDLPTIAGNLYSLVSSEGQRVI